MDPFLAALWNLLTRGGGMYGASNTTAFPMQSSPLSQNYLKMLGWSPQPDAAMRTAPFQASPATSWDPSSSEPYWAGLLRDLNMSPTAFDNTPDVLGSSMPRLWNAR